MIVQAYFIDREFPGLTIDEHMDKIMEMEESIYGLKLVKKFCAKF